MSESTPQTYKTHTRFDPPYHFFALPVTLITFFVSLWQLYKVPGLGSAFTVVTSIAMVIIVFKVRLYALKVQDRLIRLEERLRLMQLLPEPWRARIGELREGQLVALRFAPDAEVPRLVEQTLAGNWEGADIKKAIQKWRADDFRV